MGRYLISFTILFTAFLTLSVPVASEIFTDSGLMDIPTGEVLKHGIFGVGVYAPFQNTTYFKRDPVVFRINFGMFDRIELGASHILPQDNDASRSFLGHVKAQLLNESGKIPNVAIGIDNLGDNVEQKWNTYHANSAYLVISKTFNLPRIHLISGHIGVGNHRFAFDERPIGLFAGVSTEVHPAFARGDIVLSLEFDGKGANTGLRYTADSGLQIALGVETLNKPEDMRHLVSVSWTNAQMLEQIDAAKRLARQAAKLASQAKTKSTKKEETPKK
ncbi:hypothetical protein C6501_02610 [Candidatus Poribacteria bacterium]|nr:MAG: hypothetical protein C6501_02610 [Candidatus Poribacteria bacterium]